MTRRTASESSSRLISSTVPSQGRWCQGTVLGLPNLSWQESTRPPFLGFQGEDEGAAVGVAAAAGVPVEVGHRAEAGVFRRQARQGGVDGLLLRADQADLHLAVLQGEDLGPEHGGVGDADELEAASGPGRSGR